MKYIAPLGSGLHALNLVIPASRGGATFAAEECVDLFSILAFCKLFTWHSLEYDEDRDVLQ